MEELVVLTGAVLGVGAVVGVALLAALALSTRRELRRVKESIARSDHERFASALVERDWQRRR
jgi:hypothetical protein